MRAQNKSRKCKQQLYLEHSLSGLSIMQSAAPETKRIISDSPLIVMFRILKFFLINSFILWPITDKWPILKILLCLNSLKTAIVLNATSEFRHHNIMMSSIKKIWDLLKIISNSVMNPIKPTVSHLAFKMNNMIKALLRSCCIYSYSC